MRLACTAFLLAVPACAKACASEPAPPSFRRDVVPALLKGCASANGCHGDKPTHSVYLDLRAPAAYSQLVGVEAEARSGAVRVKPGDPAASFLLDKLRGSLLPREGKRMPIDPDTGVPLEPSPMATDFDDVLTRWIAAGAPNN